MGMMDIVGAIFTVIATVTIPAKEILCAQLKELDADSILNSLQQQELRDNLREYYMGKEKSVQKSEGRDRHYGSLNSDINILQHDDNNDNEKGLAYSNIVGDYRVLDLEKQITKYIKEQNLNRVKDSHELSSNKRLKPNTLLGSLDKNSIAQDSIDDLSGYSKIYVILNPKALQRGKYKNKLSDLVSKIISSFTSTRGTRQKRQRYKGFLVQDDLFARRYNRDSKEGHTGSKDSMDEEYRPKRQRSEFGSPAGRTAIPYIRQRGDIYERDRWIQEWFKKKIGSSCRNSEPYTRVKPGAQLV